MTPNKIILHCSATQDSKTVSWGAIRKWHMGLTGSPDPSSKDYNKYIESPMMEIGYHWGVEIIGDHYEIMQGRRPTQTGAHTIGQNDSSLGLCVVGNFDIDIVTPELADALHELFAWVIPTFKIPLKQIYGHCEFANKSCPGKNLFAWLKKLREGADVT